MSEDEEFIEYLRRSREQVGELEPVIVTEDGRVIDGRHRLEAYPGWRRVIVKASKKEALRERIHRTLKSRVTRKERQAQILEYALYLEDEGVKPEEMVSALARELPFSERYLRKLLPKKYKRRYLKSEKLTEERQFGTEFRIEGFPEHPSAVSEVPAEKPRPRRMIPRAFACPECRVEIETLRCSKCFSELEVKEIAKILRRLTG